MGAYKYIDKIRKILIGKIYNPDESSELIKELLNGHKPAMIGRFGSTEIKAVLYPKMPAIMRRKYYERISGNMDVLSGFFPSNDSTLREFSKLMYNDMQLLDLIGSWRIEELFLRKQYKSAGTIELQSLEPYFLANPWTEALKGKKVLVIHPFSETIQQQYKIREKLFTDDRVLPEFESLQTIKAVQTIAGNSSEFKSWFEALNYMKREIDNKEFDIAIIGCGAYGFPLAAHVKRIGKKAVHLGGSTQMLFGIKGKRWVEREKFNNIINEHFVYPLDSDIPVDAQKVEGGCYWK